MLIIPYKLTPLLSLQNIYMTSEFSNVFCILLFHQGSFFTSHLITLKPNLLETYCETAHINLFVLVMLFDFIFTKTLFTLLDHSDKIFIFTFFNPLVSSSTAFHNSDYFINHISFLFILHIATSYMRFYCFKSQFINGYYCFT